MKLMGQSVEDKLKGDENKSGESFKLGEVWFISCQQTISWRRVAAEDRRMRFYS